MNRDEDLEIIKNNVGKECERTLACNSLKIRFGEKSPYIWLDPPWELWSNEGLVVSSLDYPENDDEFQLYSENLNPLNKTKLLNFEYTTKNGLALYFQRGYRVQVPATIELVGEDEFYHHWYASK